MMVRLTDEALAEVSNGASIAATLENWLSTEEPDFDGELSVSAKQRLAGFKSSLTGCRDRVLGMMPEASGADISRAIEEMAASGCRNALGHMLFARKFAR